MSPALSVGEGSVLVSLLYVMCWRRNFTPRPDRGHGRRPRRSSLLIGRDDQCAGQGVAEEVEPQDGRSGVGADAELLQVHGVHREHVAVGAVAGGGSSADVAGAAGVIAERDRPGGQVWAAGAAGTGGARS